MDKSHPRFMEKLENVEEQGFSYKKTSIPTPEGEFLWSQIRENQYTTTLEIGCALRIASLYICDALSGAEEKSHTIIDPYQTSEWKIIGVRNLKKLGFNFFKLINEVLLHRPRWMALYKTDEDHREFNWYEEF